MIKKFKTLKTTLIMGILLVSVFMAFTPSSSAQGGSLFDSLVDINWERLSVDPITPNQDLRPYGLRVNYTVTKGFVGGLIYQIYVGRVVNIKLELINSPSWSTVILSKGTLQTSVPSVPGKTSFLSTDLWISVDETAPAFTQGKITLKSSVEKIGTIGKFEQEFDLPISADYLALLSPDLPETNTKRIGPMDTAVFPVDVTNLGNARTKIYFEIEYVPDDWIAVVTDSITVERGEKGTAYVTVKPPKGFGYHDDDASIRVKMTPAYADDPTIRGASEPVTLVVESRGISVIGIEVILPIIVVIILAIVAIYWFIKRMQRK